MLPANVHAMLQSSVDTLEA